MNLSWKRYLKRDSLEKVKFKQWTAMGSERGRQERATFQTAGVTWTDVWRTK
jgi:hypothetical protein